MTFENIVTKGEDAQNENSLLVPICSTLFNNYTYIYRDFYIFLSTCFQSRLLQICDMGERVKTILETAHPVNLLMTSTRDTGLCDKH